MLDEWVVGGNQEYAAPEPQRNSILTAESAPYDRSDNFQYLGRPKGFLARFLHWDEKFEEMGPTLTRLVGLARDLLEHTDIIQSLVTQKLGVSGRVYDSDSSDLHHR